MKEKDFESYQKIAEFSRSEEKREKIERLLNDSEIRNELLTRKIASYTEEQLLQAEACLNGTDESEHAHLQLMRLFGESSFDFSDREGIRKDANPPPESFSRPGRSKKKPDLEGYDRIQK